MRIRKRPRTTTTTTTSALSSDAVLARNSWSVFQEEHDHRLNRKNQLVANKQQDEDAGRYNNITRKRSGRSTTPVDEEQGLLALAWATTITMRQESHDSTGLHWQKCKPECSNVDVVVQDNDGIGEEPRTPPPFCGDKPHEKRQQACSCSNKRRRRGNNHQADHSNSNNNRKRRIQPPPSHTTWYNSNSRKDVVDDDHHQRDDKQLLPQDTAESNGCSSHENCGPENRLEADGEAADGSSGDSNRHTSQGMKTSSSSPLLKEMGPLLRAVHAVISEAGIEGLTAREASDIILNRNMLAEGEIPRSVKMAKAMRDSPYLLELGKTGKFVLWSTFLEESGKRAGTFVKQRQQVPQHQQPEKSYQPQSFNVKRKRQNHTRTAVTRPVIKEPHDLLARVLEHVEKTLKEKTVSAPMLVSNENVQLDGQVLKQEHRQVIDINCNPPPEEDILATVVKKPWPMLDLNIAPEEQDRENW